MAASISSGPIINAGTLFGMAPGQFPVEYNQDATSMLSYKGIGLLDVRGTPLNKDNILPGTIKSFFGAIEYYSVDKIPNTLGTAGISALANVTNGTALTLAAASTGISTNIPIVGSNNTNAVTIAPIALDFGFDYGNCTASSVTITVANSSLYRVGQPLVIANVGNAGGTSALLTNVASVPTSTTITVTNAPLATNAAAPVGNGNNWTGLVGSPNQLPTAALPYTEAGGALFYDELQGISRGISISGVSGGAGGAFLVSGWDVYGNVQTQTITVAAGANTVNSTKTWKYINSITPQFTDAHNYSVGTADLYGFAMRNDEWEHLEIYWGGALVTSGAGWTAADLTSPATATTGDVRGTYAVQSASNGTKRLVIVQRPPYRNAGRAGTNSSQFLFGVTPV